MASLVGVSLFGFCSVKHLEKTGAMKARAAYMEQTEKENRRIKTSLAEAQNALNAKQAARDKALQESQAQIARLQAALNAKPADGVGTQCRLDCTLPR